MESVAQRIGTHELRAGPRKGEKVVLCALTVEDYARCRSEALAQYKRNIISGYLKNLDLVDDPEEQKALRQQAFAEAAKIRYEDLPKKEIEMPMRDGSGYARNSRGDLVMRTHTVDYGMWWMSNDLDGFLFATWLSMTKHPSQATMTIGEAAEIFSDSGDLEEAVELAGELSTPSLVGNGRPPRTEGEKRRRRRKRKTKKSNGR